MKKKRKINGIWYSLEAFINADSTVTVLIKAQQSTLPVFKKTYSMSAEGAMAQAWYDHKQILTNKIKVA
jgi:hypothetical protein